MRRILVINHPNLLAAHIDGINPRQLSTGKRPSVSEPFWRDKVLEVWAELTTVMWAYAGLAGCCMLDASSEQIGSVPALTNLPKRSPI